MDFVSLDLDEYCLLRDIRDGDVILTYSEFLGWCHVQVTEKGCLLGPLAEKFQADYDLLVERELLCMHTEKFADISHAVRITLTELAEASMFEYAPPSKETGYDQHLLHDVGYEMR